MFRPYDVWRHRNCLDIDVEIVKVVYRAKDYLEMKIRYVARGKNYYYDDSNGRPQKVKIYKKDWPNWELIFHAY